MKTQTYIHITALFLCMIMLTACSDLLSKATPTSVPIEQEDFTPIVSVTGKVLPAKWSNLSMSAEGVVAEISVDEGQKVSSEQLLVRLEGKEKHQAAIAQANHELTSAQKNLDDLTINLILDRQQALLDIAQGYEAMRSADRQLYYFTVPSNQRDLDMFSAVDKMQANLNSARKAWDPYKYIEEFLPARNRFDLKKKLDDTEGDFRTAMLRINYAADAGMAQAKLDRAREDYEKLQKGPDPDKVKLAEARLQNARAALAAAEMAIKDLELRAPFSGEISRLNVREHEWVSPGQTVIILSDPASLQVETTDLGEIDVARVKVGNPVKLTFDALPDLTIKGEVIRIAPKNTETSGVNYTVVIKLSELNPVLRWGMTAFADIEVGD
ncbi:MAG: HlyD family efflux transporter periplasmic adaptor subunit [Chloroflexota bacterium]